jgi:DNA-binding CsgD family transcriptional regulator
MSQSGLEQTADIEGFLLTRTELVGLKLAANGNSARDIARRMGVSEREMETLFFCAERKLRAKNRLHAVAIAVSQGLIGIVV